MRDVAKEVIDTKAIEEKALNHFKSFIEDSKVISQYVADNDKEPCWDGHLNLYSDGIRDKNHLQGRVPVQIKGTEVSKFVTKKWKFALEKEDLQAYLNEPTFFVVCQIKKGSKERKLFYRELLPSLVRTLLRDMGNQKSRKTIFHPLTENLKEFEDQLMVFLSNSKKMISFAGTAPLSMADAIKRGIKEFSFVAPADCSNMLKLLKYLSTHNTYLYAKIVKDLDVEMPLSDGPARFEFKREDNSDVKVGDKVYFKGYRSEIKDGRILIKIADVMTINLPIDSTDQVKPTMKMTTKAKYLKDAINEVEFGVALNDIGVLSIGSVNLLVKMNEKDFVEKMRKDLARWKELDNVLNKLHVSKPFDLTNITEEQGRLINILIETIGKGNTIKLPGQKSTLLLLEISNIKLLLWCGVGKDDECVIGDFFDRSIRISYKIDDNKTINVSPYSYLQLEKFWEKVDNIDFDGLVPSAQEVAKAHNYCYHMSNYDVLAMISAADALETLDADKRNTLLGEALKLDEWLINNDPAQEMIPVHIINKLQIFKRQRELAEAEIQELESMLNNGVSESFVKVGASLLLGRQKEAEEIFNTLSDEEKSRVQEFPIWKYADFD